MLANFCTADANKATALNGIRAQLDVMKRNKDWAAALQFTDKVVGLFVCCLLLATSKLTTTLVLLALFFVLGCSLFPLCVLFALPAAGAWCDA